MYGLEPCSQTWQDPSLLSWCRNDNNYRSKKKFWLGVPVHWMFTYRNQSWSWLNVHVLTEDSCLVLLVNLINMAHHCNIKSNLRFLGDMQVKVDHNTETETSFSITNPRGELFFPLQSSIKVKLRVFTCCTFP